MDLRFSPSFDLECRANKLGIVEGVASVFNGPADSYGDVIVPGAFTKSLTEHKAAKTAPVMLWAHDTAKPVGRWDKLTETPKGLEVRGRINLKTDAGKNAFEHVSAGDVSGLSIGFRVPEGGAVYEGSNRYLKEIDLAEISMVSLPAQRLARISEVRSMQTRADFRDLLRGVGLSRRAADKLATGGWPALAGETPEEIEIRELARQMRELAARISTPLNGPA